MGSVAPGSGERWGPKLPVILTMFLPGGAAALVTAFQMMSSLHLVNSLWALVTIGGVGCQISGIFILRQFIEDIPRPHGALS